MRIGMALEIAAIALLLVGWIGARFSAVIAKHRRRLIEAGIVLLLIDAGIVAVRGAINGYQDAIAETTAARQKTGPAR